MERYRNSRGNSGVSAFEIGTSYIDVKFSGTARVYRYSYQKAGQNHVEVMKKMANKGSGLNSYIMRNVKELYDK